MRAPSDCCLSHIFRTALTGEVDNELLLVWEHALSWRNIVPSSGLKAMKQVPVLLLLVCQDHGIGRVGELNAKGKNSQIERRRMAWYLVRSTMKTMT